MSQVNKTYTIKEVVKNGKKYYLRFEEIDEDYLVNEDQFIDLLENKLSFNKR